METQTATFKSTGFLRGKTAICTVVTSKRIFIATAGVGAVQFMEVQKKDFRRHIKRMNNPQVRTMTLSDRPDMIWITEINELDQ